ncbi:MAG: glycoside hydrolase family 27 protein [Muribaculaceae bacterium]
MKLFGLIVVLLSVCLAGNAQNESLTSAVHPPMGWNSFDSYGVYCHEEAALANLEAMSEKLKPFGYIYFVIDNGWFGEYELEENSMYSVERHASNIHINQYGLVEPSHTYFPNGFKQIVDKCHAKGLKFGLHLMRGIPRKAVELNTPIKGTKYHAADIADTINVCAWCNYNYGIDMAKPGAQEYYNSLINQLAEWGVDFIKYDDIVPFPQEVNAITKAIKQCGRPILLSLSPGDKVNEEDLPALCKADMLRVTADIWDTQHSINLTFDAWKRWQGTNNRGVWFDMDMIPFGKLQLMSPPGRKGKNQKEIALSGRGTTRWCELNDAQKYTFITQRAMAASPLFFGGDIVSIDDFSYSLLTNPEMLSCNQNGVMGSLVYQQDGIEVWKVKEKNHNAGWIGVFNRNNYSVKYVLDKDKLGLEDSFAIIDIWNSKSN